MNNLKKKLNPNSVPWSESPSNSQFEEQKNQNNSMNTMTEEKPPGLGFEKSYGNIALDLNQEPKEFYFDKDSSQGKNISSSTSQENLILDTIIQKKLNYADILHRIASKTKKAIDIIKSKGPNLKLFKCVYLYDNKTIGSGEGKNYKEAKNASAKQAIENLINKKEYSLEKSEITIMVLGGCSQGRPQFMNNSELYELDFIAKRCLIEPEWAWSIECGKFRVAVRLPEIEASGLGERKKFAERDAARNLITKIKKDEELSKKYYPQTKF